MPYELKYRFVDKGSDHTWLFLPGWAMNSRIFDHISCKDNMLLIDQLDPVEFSTQLELLLTKKLITSFSLFGFSLGGFQAASLLENSDYKASRVILCGIQKRYRPDVIFAIKQQLDQNKKDTLSGFYRNCFSNKKDYDDFSNKFENDFIAQFDSSYLQLHLDTLISAPIKTINCDDSTMIHGNIDAITPISSSKSLAKRLDCTLTIIEDCGHYLFFNPNGCLQVEALLN
jgi:pimeloyl-ACP methyl ester carboxylesterase